MWALDWLVYQTSHKSPLQSLCSCSVAKSCPTLCNPIGCNAAHSSVLCYLLEFSQIYVH